MRNHRRYRACVTTNSQGQDQRTEAFRQAVMYELTRQSRAAQTTRDLLMVLVIVVLVSIVLAIFGSQL